MKECLPLSPEGLAFLRGVAEQFVPKWARPAAHDGPAASGTCDQAGLRRVTIDVHPDDVDASLLTRARAKRAASEAELTLKAA